MQGPLKPKIIALAAFIASLYGFACRAETIQQPNGPPVGSVAPDVKVKNALTGEEAPLSSLRGKVVVMTFWAAWCPSCRQELPVLERIQEIVGKDNLTALAINYRENPDSWGRLKKAAAGWQITLVDDQSGWIARHYKVTLIPHMFIIDREGKILANHLGYGRTMNTELAAEINRALAVPTTPITEGLRAQPTSNQPDKTVSGDP